MQFVGLISGGKDSIFSIINSIQNGHELICLAHLSSSKEKDSYMFQSIGSNLIEIIAECIGKPLIQREMGLSLNIEKNYVETSGDEVEELYFLLKEVKNRFPNVNGVSTGAILSSYQRVRIENVCERLGLMCLSYLWMQPQSVLLKDMVDYDMEAILVKVAALGLNEKQLGLSLKQVYPKLIDLNSKFGLHLCGEGGEYETIVLDCPLYRKRIEIAQSQIVPHGEGVWYLDILQANIIEKDFYEMETRDFSQILKTPKFEDQDLGLSCQRVLPNLESLSTNSEEIMVPNFSKNPVFTLAGGYFTVSGLISPHKSLAGQTKEIFNNLINILNSNNLNLQNLVLVTVQLPSMSCFSEFNNVYSNYFKVDPPARVTISTNSQLQLDVLGSTFDKDHLHVKGISYWAPSNIGPYSQLVSTNKMEFGFMAGMIGLTPASMELSNNELGQCMTSLGRIVENFNNELVYGFVYVVNGVDIELVKRLWVGNRIGIIRVSGLPRNAKVEVQCVVGKSEIKFERTQWKYGIVDESRCGNLTVFHACLNDPTELDTRLEADWDTIVSIRVFYIACIKDRIKHIVEKWAKKEVSITYVPVLEVGNNYKAGVTIYCFKT